MEIYAKGQDAPLTLAGDAPNTIEGTWLIKAGRLVLAKPPDTDALCGTILVAGDGDLLWNAGNQINDAARIELLGSDKGAASLNLNGFSDRIDRLTLAAGTKVFTGGPSGGVLAVRELWVDGERLPRGVYTSSVGWLHGNGYVVVGDVKDVDISGGVDDPNKTIGADNIARLKAAAAFKLPEGDCTVNVATGDFPLTLSADGAGRRYDGLITGRGSLRIEGAPAISPSKFPEFTPTPTRASPRSRAAC